MNTTYTNAVAKHKNVSQQRNNMAQTFGQKPVKKSTQKFPSGTEDQPVNTRRVDSADANFPRHGRGFIQKVNNSEEKECEKVLS